MFIILSLLFLILFKFCDHIPFLKNIEVCIMLYKRIYHVLSHNYPDTRKEKMIKIYSLKLFLINLKIAGLIGIVLVIFFSILYVISYLIYKDTSLFHYLFTIGGFYSSLLSAFLYYLTKKIYARKQV